MLRAWRDGEPDFQKMAEIVRNTGAHPILASFRVAYRRFVTERFDELSAKWKSKRRATSSIARMVAHPAYGEIINLGIEAVPMILADLVKTPDHWFVALSRITGADPVPESARGNIKAMTKAWIDWGKSRKIEIA